MFGREDNVEISSREYLSAEKSIQSRISLRKSNEVL